MIPPSLREDEFRESVGRWLGQIRWLAFEPGVAPVKNGPAGAAGAVPAHAHLKFESPTAAIDFSALVDGAPYRDCEGFESRVTVEWALSQRVPAAAGSRRGGQRIDRKAGTIESDDAYLAFLEALDTPTAAQAATEPATAGLGGPKDAVVVTPLMAYLRDKERKRVQRAAAQAAKRAEAVEKRRLEERRRAELLAKKEKLRRAQEERRDKNAERAPKAGRTPRAASATAKPPAKTAPPAKRVLQRAVPVPGLPNPRPPTHRLCLPSPRVPPPLASLRHCSCARARLTVRTNALVRVTTHRALAPPPHS